MIEYGRQISKICKSFEFAAAEFVYLSQHCHKQEIPNWQDMMQESAVVEWFTLVLDPKSRHDGLGGVLFGKADFLALYWFVYPGIMNM